MTVIILIIGILAAAGISVMRGRIDSARWSEGKAAAGTIATALRAYATEEGSVPAKIASNAMSVLGFTSSDLDGTYFTVNNYSVSGARYNSKTGNLTYLITVTKGAGITAPTRITLDQDGVWTP